MGTTKHLGLLAGLCAAVGTLVNLNTLDCGFCFDDDRAIVKNRDVYPNSSWSNILWDDFWGTPMMSSKTHGSYRPLCVATFRLNYLLHELQPMGYHLVNVILHSAVCFLYVQLCGVVFGEARPALIAGLLFAVHPIHTEAVAGVVGRADLLSGLFFVAVVLSYHKATTYNEMVTSLKWLLFTLVLCLCSTLSKETGITAVGVCICYEVFLVCKLDAKAIENLFRRKKPPQLSRGLVYRSVVLLAFTGVFMIMRLKLMQGIPKFSINDNQAMMYSTPARQLQMLHLCFVNVWLLFNPFHLSCDWRRGAVPAITSFADPWNLATIATFAGLVAITAHSITSAERKKKIILFSTAVIVLPYIPASNLFFPVGFTVAERVLYIPSMGFCILVAYSVLHLLRNVGYRGTKVLVLMGVSYLLVTFSAKTLHRNRDWYSNMALYSSAVRVFPQNSYMINNLAYEYNQQGNKSLTEELLRTSISLAPNVSIPHLTLAVLVLVHNPERFAEAEKELRMAAKLSQRDSDSEQTATTYYELAKHLHGNGNRSEEALKMCDVALSLRPGFSEFLYSKGAILLKLERYNEAKLTFMDALHDNPDHVGVHYKLGKALVELGDVKNAEKHFRKVLSLDKNDALAKFQIGSLLLKSANVEKLREAEALLLDVYAFEPTNENVLLSLALVYYDLQDFPKAEHMFLKVLERDHAHQSSLYNLGFMYVNNLHRYKEALEVLLKLVDSYPHHVNGHNQIANCYVHMQQVDRAMEAYRAALKLDPNSVLALLNLGIVKAEFGKLEEAGELLARVLQLQPGNTAAKNKLKQVKEKLKNQKH